MNYLKDCYQLLRRLSTPLRASLFRLVKTRGAW
jgi:hypothetical protein